MGEIARSEPSKQVILLLTDPAVTTQIQLPARPIGLESGHLPGRENCHRRKVGQREDVGYYGHAKDDRLKRGASHHRRHRHCDTIAG